MTDPSPLELALLVAKAFEANGVRYILGGSLASTVFGEPRATLDIDMAADLSPATVGPWLADMTRRFDSNERWIRDEVQRRGSFQITHRATMTRVDVFVPTWEGVHLWKWETRRRLVLDPASGAGLDVTGPEGVIVQKMLWYRDGGESSDRQWRDILGVLKSQSGASGILDRAMLETWCGHTGVADLLQRALSETDG